jgi:hypothetical protein
MTSNTVSAEMSPPAETEFAVCARLLRALSHIVRGDLSVITNDLTYLSAIAPPEELERPRARCASAAATLGKVNIITGSMSVEGVSLSEIVRELGGAFEVESAWVRGDSRKLTWIAQTLRGLIGELVVRSVTRAPPDSFVIECYAVSSADCGSRRGSLSGERYSSLGEYASRELGEREVVEASLLDLVFHGFTWGLCLESGPAGVALRFVVPREDKRR